MLSDMLQHLDMPQCTTVVTVEVMVVTVVVTFMELVPTTVLVTVPTAVVSSNLTPMAVVTIPTRSSMYTEDGTQRAMLSSTSLTFSRVLASLTEWDTEVSASMSRLVATPALAVIPLICTATEPGITITITMVTMATVLSTVPSLQEEFSIATIMADMAVTKVVTAVVHLIWEMLTHLLTSHTETMLGATFEQQNLSTKTG